MVGPGHVNMYHRHLSFSLLLLLCLPQQQQRPRAAPLPSCCSCIDPKRTRTKSQRRTKQEKLTSSPLPGFLTLFLPAPPFLSSPARSANVLTITVRGRTKSIVGPQRRRDVRDGAILTTRRVRAVVDVRGEESAKGRGKERGP